MPAYPYLTEVADRSAQAKRERARQEARERELLAKLKAKFGG